jgi:hypothetical protein
MQRNGSFRPKFTFHLHRSIRYSRANHDVLFYLRNWATAHTEYVMGCTVNNLLKLWVCRLSFLNSSPAIMPLAALYFWVNFSKGRFSLKNGTICPLISHDTSSFKDTCLLIYLIEAKVALYVFNGQPYIPVLNNNRKRTVWVETPQNSRGQRSFSPHFCS